MILNYIHIPIRDIKEEEITKVPFWFPFVFIFFIILSCYLIKKYLESLPFNKD
jgi:hypothetical protein